MTMPRLVLHGTFGRLTVIGPAPDVHVGGRIRTACRCRCTCGRELNLLTTNLRNGGTRSCGCARLEAVAAAGARRKAANQVRKQNAVTAQAALVAAIALLSGVLSASPFLVSDPLPAETTHCGLRVDNDTVIDTPVTLEGNDTICKVDLLGLPVTGSYVVTLTAIVAGPPRLESGPSATFHLRETVQPNSARIRWQGWTNLFCPDSGEPCYWQ